MLEFKKEDPADTCPDCGADVKKVLTEQGITVSVCTKDPKHIREYPTTPTGFATQDEILKIPRPRTPMQGPKADFKK